MVTLKFKTIRNTFFEIENVDASQTFGQVKSLVFEKKGDDFPVDGQRIILKGSILSLDEYQLFFITIFPGAIMKDDQTVSDSKYDEKNDFFVIIGPSKKPAPVCFCMSLII